MRTVECSVTVDETRTAVIQLPDDVAPGQHHLLVAIDAPPAKVPYDPLAGFPTIRLGCWPKDLSLRREDMYGDDGR